MGINLYTRGKLEYKMLVIVMATPLLLAACGGGSTSNGGGTTDTPANNTGSTTSNADNLRTNANEDITVTFKAAAEANPVYGSVSQIHGASPDSAAEANPVYGSVSQIHGASPDSAAEATKETDGNYILTLPTASGSDITLETDTDLLITGDTVTILDNVEIISRGLYKGDNDKATLAVVYSGDIGSLDNWMVGGTWVHISGLSNDQANWEVGAFIDGPEISEDPSLPTGGEAGYTGVATGSYAAKAGTDLEDIAEGAAIIGDYAGEFSATANFNNGGGTLSGRIIITESIDYIVIGDSIEPITNFAKDSTISWEDISFNSNGQATGDVVVTVPNLVLVENTGKIGNRFSSINVNGNPRLIAGTHGGSIRSDGGTEAGYIGAHIGGINP